VRPSEHNNLKRLVGELGHRVATQSEAAIMSAISPLRDGLHLLDG
jgi:hypothetical protein